MEKEDIEKKKIKTENAQRIKKKKDDLFKR